MESGLNIFEQLPPHPFPEWMSGSACETPLPHATECRHHRSIWISDVHLGTSGAKADLLCDFLKYNSCDTLYLVGDIIDGWRMKNHAYWPQEHVNVVRHILACAKRGTKIVYITGNHDEFLRHYSGMSFGNIHLVDEYLHHSPSGKQYWVVHGDGYDAVVFNKQWLAVMGDVAYNLLLKVNIGLNRARNSMGLRSWSFSSYMKNKVRNAFSIVSNYETTLTHECEKRELDGVICGHIHSPTVKKIKGIQYANCGDWVESCSALVEDKQGHLTIIKGSTPVQNDAREPSLKPEMV